MVLDEASVKDLLRREDFEWLALERGLLDSIPFWLSLTGGDVFSLVESLLSW